MKSVEDLTLLDDFLFCKLMEDKEECMHLLKIITGKNIKNIEYVDTQKTFDLIYKAKGVRLDVFVQDEDTIYNIEMQVSKDKDLAKRTRYYRSMMDMDTMIKGSKYNKLPESIIIVISPFDYIGKNLPMYEFKSYCKQNKDIKLNDGTKTIFLNLKADLNNLKNEDLKAFCKYLNGEKVNNNFVDRIDEKVNIIKSKERFKVSYMKWLEMMEDKWLEGREEGIEIGLEKGLQQGRQEGIQMQINSLIRFNVSKENIIQELIKSYALTRKQAEEYYDKYSL